MTAEFQRMTQGDISFEPATRVDRWAYVGTPPTLPGGDFFSYVASLALSNTPMFIVEQSIGKLWRQTIQLHENWYARDYEITVTYGRVQRDVGAYQIVFDQTGGTALALAGERISGWGRDGGGIGAEEPKTDPRYNNRGLIGKDGDEVRGEEIPVNSPSLTVLFRHPQAFLNRVYIRRIGRLVGHPNQDDFLGYEPGEVRFRGGNFTETNTEATAQYNFEIAYNVKEADDFRLGKWETADGSDDGILIKEKAGWDVISPVYEDVTDDDDKKPVKKLEYVEIIRPRPFKDYAAESGFGWGGSTEEE